jgi:hypothetical protein
VPTWLLYTLGIVAVLALAVIVAAILAYPRDNSF